MEENREKILSNLSKKLIISAPFVQRSYEWGEKKFMKLLLDITLIILGDPIYGKHDLQTMLLEKNKKLDIGKNGLIVMKLWDGIQRTISIYIIILTVAILLIEKNDTYGNDLINDYLVNHTENDQWYYKIHINNKIDAPIKELLNYAINGIPISDEWTNTIVHKNYKHCYKYLEKYSVEDLKEFVNKLDQLSVMWKEGDEYDDMNKEYRLANSKNDGISDYHFIKSCLLNGKTDEEIPIRIKTYFQDMEDLLYDQEANSKRKKTIELERFLKLVMHFSPKLKLGDKNRENWVDIFERQIRLYPDKEELIEEIYSYFKHHKLILGYDSSDKLLFEKINEFHIMGADLRKLFFGFAIDYYNGIISNTEFVELIHDCENLLLRSHCNGTKDKTKNFLNKLWNRGNPNKIDKNDYVNSFKRILLHPVTRSPIGFSNNYEFRVNFSKYQWTTSGTGSGMHDFLEIVIQKNYADKKNQNIIQFGQSKEGNYFHSKDHICPQTVLEDEEHIKLLPGGREEARKIKEQYMNNAGNLTATKYNSEMSKKIFKIKRTMEKGYKSDKLVKTDKLVGKTDSDVWGIDEIKWYREWQFELILDIFPMISIDDTLETFRAKMQMEAK